MRHCRQRHAKAKDIASPFPFHANVSEIVKRYALHVASIPEQLRISRRDHFPEHPSSPEKTPKLLEPIFQDCRLVHLHVTIQGQIR